MNWQIADNLHFSPWAHLNLFFVKDRGQAVETSWIVRETEREQTRHSPLGSTLRVNSVVYSKGFKGFPYFYYCLLIEQKEWV